MRSTLDLLDIINLKKTATELAQRKLIDVVLSDTEWQIAIAKLKSERGIVVIHPSIFAFHDAVTLLLLHMNVKSLSSQGTSSLLI